MGASFRLPLSNRTGCGRDAHDLCAVQQGLAGQLVSWCRWQRKPSEATPNPAYTPYSGRAGETFVFDASPAVPSFCRCSSSCHLTPPPSVSLLLPFFVDRRCFFYRASAQTSCPFVDQCRPGLSANPGCGPCEKSWYQIEFTLVDCNILTARRKISKCFTILLHCGAAMGSNSARKSAALRSDVNKRNLLFRQTPIRHAA